MYDSDKSYLTASTSSAMVVQVKQEETPKEMMECPRYSFRVSIVLVKSVELWSYWGVLPTGSGKVWVQNV